MSKREKTYSFFMEAAKPSGSGHDIPSIESKRLGEGWLFSRAFVVFYHYPVVFLCFLFGVYEIFRKFACGKGVISIS